MSDEILVGDWAEIVDASSLHLPHPDGTRKLQAGDVILVEFSMIDYHGYKYHGSQPWLSLFGPNTVSINATRLRKFTLRVGDWVECISDDLCEALHPTEDRPLRRGDRFQVYKLDELAAWFLYGTGGLTHGVYRNAVRPLPRANPEVVVACTCSPAQLLWGGHTCGLANTDGTSLLA